MEEMSHVKYDCQKERQVDMKKLEPHNTHMTNESNIK